MKNFLEIYKNNRLYHSEDKNHKKIIFFQLILMFLVIIITIINLFDFKNSNHYWFLDQYDRIYALLIAVILTVIVVFNNLINHKELKKKKVNYLNITYKDDYLSIIMYTLFLSFTGMLFNIIYAILFEYLNLKWLDIISWAIALYLLLNTIVFTCYTLLHMNKLLKKI